MFHYLAGLSLLMTAVSPAFGAETETAPHSPNATFQSLVCRSYDYYALGGNRKVLELSVKSEQTGTFQIQVSRVFETLSSNLEYREQSRITETDIKGLSCLQAAPQIDEKVIACTDFGKEYLSLSKVERTGIASPSSSTPGKILSSSSYEGELLRPYSEGRMTFNTQDCVLDE